MDGRQGREDEAETEKEFVKRSLEWLGSRWWWAEGRKKVLSAT